MDGLIHLAGVQLGSACLIMSTAGSTQAGVKAVRRRGRGQYTGGSKGSTQTEARAVQRGAAIIPDKLPTNVFSLFWEEMLVVWLIMHTTFQTNKS